MSFLGAIGAAVGSKLLDAGTDFAINNYMFNRQKHWQKEQLTHAHQWEVQDLKNAGLNPILSANTGASGASAPAWSGSSNTSAADFLMQKNEMQRKDKQIDNETKATEAQTKIADSQVALNAAQAYRILTLTPEEVKTHEWGRQSRFGKELGAEKEYQDAKNMLIEQVQNSAETFGRTKAELEQGSYEYQKKTGQRPTKNSKKQQWYGLRQRTPDELERSVYGGYGHHNYY